MMPGEQTEKCLVEKKMKNEIWKKYKFVSHLVSELKSN